MIKTTIASFLFKDLEKVMTIIFLLALAIQAGMVALHAWDYIPGDLLLAFFGIEVLALGSALWRIAGALETLFKRRW